MNSLPLTIEEPRWIDAALLAQHEFEEQLAAEVAQVGNRRRQPRAQPGPAATGGSEDRAVAAGDATLLAHGADVSALQ